MADLMPTMPSLSTTAPGQGPARAAVETRAARLPRQPGLVVTSVTVSPDGDQATQQRVTAANQSQLQDTGAFGLSAQAFRELKDSGGTALTLKVGNTSAGSDAGSQELVTEMDGLLGEMGGFEGIQEAVNRQADQGVLTEGERALGAESLADIRRLGLATGRLRNTGPRRVAVIVNDRRVWLDAITATGSLSNGRDDFQVSAMFLDDAANPLTLRLDVDGQVTEVTRVGYAQSSPVYASQMEQALLKTCRVDVYGLDFAPGGAALEPGSDEVLSALRSAFLRHPEWTLAVQSHGDDKVSTALSNRRAQAVRDALANQDSARVIAVDLTRTAPLADNGSIAGRAFNRRTTFSRTGCPR